MKINAIIVKIVLDGGSDVCILIGMRLTKSTNKATRQWVDSILSQLDLVLCEYSYRDAHKALKSCQRCNDGKAETINYMTANNGCITKSEQARRVSLSSSNSLMGEIEAL